MKKALQRLDRIHERLLAEISTLDCDSFARQPSEAEWSVAQIIHHLSLVEDRVIKDFEATISKPPQHLGLFRKLIPTRIVAWRLVRVRAPKSVTPLEAPTKDVAIANLNRARNSLKEFCALNGDDRIKQLVFNHPFLGKIDGVATVSFVGYHEQRHYKQILEVLKKLQAPS